MCVFMCFPCCFIKTFIIPVCIEYGSTVILILIIFEMGRGYFALFYRWSWYLFGLKVFVRG